MSAVSHSAVPLSVCLSVRLSAAPIPALLSPVSPIHTSRSYPIPHPQLSAPPRLLWAPIEEATPVCLQLNESQRGEQFPARVCVRI